MDALLGRVAERWPRVRVERDRLAALLAERDLPPGDHHAIDIALAVATANGDPGALVVFDREIIPAARAALARYGDDDFVDEILQRTRVKLLVHDPDARGVALLGYRGRGALVAWVQIVAIREALMARRATKRETPTDDGLLRLAFTEPVLASARAGHKTQLANAFRAALDTLDARQRNLLRLCFLDGLGTEEIAKLYGTHRVTVFRWLRDARQRLLDRTRTGFFSKLQLSRIEAEALMRSLAASLSVTW